MGNFLVYFSSYSIVDLRVYFSVYFLVDLIVYFLVCFIVCLALPRVFDFLAYVSVCLFILILVSWSIAWSTS